ncbi:MAG: fumarylacetoacetate hydrolase family protein [Ignavibacteriales bacterium]|nr:fumarylacetoacetate hydrolase family protein [Ignavibacteriales bacterium]
MHYISFKGSSKKHQVGKIMCVGRNYAEHAKELGNDVPTFPIIFMKPASNLIHSGEPVIYPPHSHELHHEVELVLFIGSRIKNASIEEAEQAISGYGVGLDMTLRDLQNEYRKEGNPWTLAKCFDTSAVVSDFVLKADASDILQTEISLLVNDVRRQKNILADMIFKPAEVASYISHRMALEPGDLVFTGTPKGVSAVHAGDTLLAAIGDICTLYTRIVNQE